VLASGEGKQRQVQGDTYTVQPGDYLMQVARDLGFSWLELAQENSIGYPYVIYAGQVLQLPAGFSSSMEVSQDDEPDSINATTTTTTMRYRVNLPILERITSAQAPSSLDISSTSQEPDKTVIVLHTDTLIGFGRSIGVAWHVLAELNNLNPTHVLHPGEILRVR